MPSITIAVLTYRRPDRLLVTLASIRDRAVHADGWASDGVLVVDNDPDGSARQAVVGFDGAGLAVRYVMEASPGVAAARNRAVEEISSDFLVFIDDDEYLHGDNWPQGLQEVQQRHQADLVGGPVEREFEHTPPHWLAAAGVFRNDNPPTGTEQNWLRSGNLLLRVGLADDLDPMFDLAYGRTGGEDTEFTSRAHREGFCLQWSHDAAVTESVPGDRIGLGWVVQRYRQSTANMVRIELGRTQMGPPRILKRVRYATDGVIRLVGGAAMALAFILPPTRDIGVRGMCFVGKGMGFLRGSLGVTNPLVYGR